VVECGKVGEPFSAFVLVYGLADLVVEVENERVSGVGRSQGVTLGDEV